MAKKPERLLRVKADGEHLAEPFAVEKRPPVDERLRTGSAARRVAHWHEASGTLRPDGPTFAASNAKTTEPCSPVLWRVSVGIGLRRRSDPDLQLLERRRASIVTGAAFVAGWFDALTERGT